MRKMLGEFDWHTLLDGRGAAESWTIFKERLEYAIKESIPLKRRRSINKPLWMRQNVLRTIRKKRRLWDHYKATGALNDLLKYKKQVSDTKNEVLAAKKDFEDSLVRNGGNTKKFYSYMNSKTKSKDAIGDLIKEDGTLSTDDADKCNLLNRFFSSVFTQEDRATIPDVAPKITDLSLIHI